MPKNKVSPVNQWYEANKDNSFPNREAMINACSFDLGIAKNWVSKKISKLAGDPPPITSSSIPVNGMSVNALRAKHDTLFQIRTAVEILMKDRDRLYSDAEFKAITRANPSQYRAKADLDEFAKCRGEVHQTIYWGHPDTIKQLKNEGVLQ